MKTLEQQRHMLLEMTNTINTHGERNTTRAEFKRELTQALKEAEERGRLLLPAYMEFVDEMAVDMPFSIAFDSLNERLEALNQKDDRPTTVTSGYGYGGQLQRTTRTPNKHGGVDIKIEDV